MEDESGKAFAGDSAYIRKRLQPHKVAHDMWERSGSRPHMSWAYPRIFVQVLGPGGAAQTHGKRFMGCPGSRGRRLQFQGGRNPRAAPIHTFAGTRRGVRRWWTRMWFDRMKSLMRGAISARKRDPLNTP